MFEQRSRVEVGRRTVMRAAWAAPAITVATAAPAFASSPTQAPWTITSASYQAGLTGLTGHYVLRFEIFVPANQTVLAPRAFIRLAGNGGDMDADPRTGIAPDAGTAPHLWSVKASDGGGLLSEEYKVHELTYKAGVMSGGAAGATYTLSSDILFVNAADIDANSRVEFVSGSPTTGPAVTFQLLGSNRYNGALDVTGGYITVPHVQRRR